MTASLAAFLAFVALGVPIAFALGGAAAIGLALMEGAPLAIIASRVFGAVDSFTLLAIPFFILAGELMETGGISRRLMDLARAWVGHMRGGLGNVVIFGMVLFSGVSGSTQADAAAVGSLMIPSMKRHGYSAARAGAIVAAASGMGILIPPCLTMVVYGSITNVSIGALFAAGLLPALVMALALAVHQMIDSKRAGLEPEPRVSWRLRLRALASASGALMMPVIIFGGIRGGAFTPTEAAVVAAVYAVLVGGLVYREISWSFLYRALVRTGLVSGVVMLMIGGANIFAWLMTVEQVPHKLAALIQSAGGGKTLFVALSIVVFLLLFALLDGLPGMLMLVPVIVPTAQQLGIDLLHYGIIMTTVMGVALFLPPFGVGLFIVLGIAGCGMREITRHLLPYIATMLVVALVIALVPWLSYVVPVAMGLYTVPGM
ncbi:MAG TPA: TRAP transporter large permease [Burkholderiales bacterium]|jgi:C4-dicarboxylate transporter DctM subunit|nr:TRAP transporter large permease [Burkholderiales bacterium]